MHLVLSIACGVLSAAVFVAMLGVMDSFPRESYRIASMTMAIGMGLAAFLTLNVALSIAYGAAVITLVFLQAKLVKRIRLGETDLVATSRVSRKPLAAGPYRSQEMATVKRLPLLTRAWRSYLRFVSRDPKRAVNDRPG